MSKTVSIVAARRELGRLADEVRRTGQPVILTRRGHAIARIAPEPAIAAGRSSANDPLRSCGAPSDSTVRSTSCSMPSAI